MTLVELTGLTYTYPGGQEAALSDVGVTIPAGEMVVLAGLSGSGKSTLLRVINGLAPHFYGGSFAGEAHIAGLDTRANGPAELAAHVGTLFQDPETQVILGTPRAELSFPLENRDWGSGAVARAVEETALALGIEALLDRRSDTLSGGELQRVALGATLVGRPALVCLDEPTSQLDPVAGDELIGLLRRLNEDTDLTVILAEHRLERCLMAADRVIALDRGRIAFEGRPADFLEWALTKAPQLVTPGARMLAGVDIDPVPGVKAGPVLLRNVDLQLAAGERVALMGRNGAGKSTLLRHAAGLMAPTRGKVEAAGRVALLLQNPGDYLVHDTVDAELDGQAASYEHFGLARLAERHPRDLSGGERQRLALAIVLGHDDGGPPPAVICLDEPTRGMDRAARDELSVLLRSYDGAVLIATHDPELAADFAQRVVLLAEGSVIADGTPAAVLGGGIYFSTETARILAGLDAPDHAAANAALLPAQGVAVLMDACPATREAGR